MNLTEKKKMKKEWRVLSLCKYCGLTSHLLIYVFIDARYCDKMHKWFILDFRDGNIWAEQARMTSRRMQLENESIIDRRPAIEKIYIPIY